MLLHKELKKDLGANNNYTKDIDLLIDQTKRCSEILKQISKKQIKEDKFFSKTNLEDLLNEIISSFKETSDKEIDLLAKNDTNKFRFQWSLEIIYGLRNFIETRLNSQKNQS